MQFHEGAAGTLATQQPDLPSNPPAPVLLVVLCGLPGAGKTTVASHICCVAPKHQVDVHHVCLDQILQQHLASLGGTAQGNGQQSSSFNAEAWQTCRQELCMRVEDLLQQHQHRQKPQQQQQQQQPVAQQQQARQVLVVVDDNNFYQSMRYEFLQLARQYAAAFLQLYLHCPLNLALQRNSARQGAARVPDAVLSHLSEVFEPPQPDKRPWEVAHTLTLQPEDLTGLSGLDTPPAQAQAAHTSTLQPEVLTSLSGLQRLQAQAEAAAGTACGELQSQSTAGSNDGDAVVDAEDSAEPAAAQAATSTACAGNTREVQPAGEAVDRLWAMLLGVWGPPVPPLPDEQELAARRAAATSANLASRVHQADLSSRAMLHAALSGLSKEHQGVAGRVLNVRRKQLLQQLRQHVSNTNEGAETTVDELLQSFQHLCLNCQAYVQ